MRIKRENDDAKHGIRPQAWTLAGAGSSYMPPGHINKVNKLITVRTPLFNVNTTSKVLNYARVGGSALSVLNIFATGYEVIQDIGNDKYYSATARVGVFVGSQLALRIPYVGIAFAVSIGIWDYKCGDNFYNSVEQKFGN